MNISDVRNSTSAVLIPADVAPILGCDPQWVRDTARTNPDVLGFPVLVIGSRVKIPRIPFLRYLGYEEVPHEPEK